MTVRQMSMPGSVPSLVMPVSVMDSGCTAQQAFSCGMTPLTPCRQSCSSCLGNFLQRHMRISGAVRMLTFLPKRERQTRGSRK